MREYRAKLTLHIPHYAWKNGRLEAVEYCQFRRRLFSALETAGITSWYTTEARGYYKGRDYDQELVTIFCDDEHSEDVIGIFRETFLADSEGMRQEELAYECNGILYVEPATRKTK